jgi:hypothetical protein
MKSLLEIFLVFKIRLNQNTQELLPSHERIIWVNEIISEDLKIKRKYMFRNVAQGFNQLRNIVRVSII